MNTKQIDSSQLKGEMNVIVGTDERDAIRGTAENDYIIAGAGTDFYILGGAGHDIFEVNYGDEVVRIADFTLGEDIIALEDVSVLETATFKQNGDRFDVVLKDGTLIRVNGVTEDDIDDMFVFRSDDGGVSDDKVSEEDHDPLAQSKMNVIVGTDERDAIRGTAENDYIIAGAGTDFYILGGAGHDIFEVNYGDEVVRIADFTLGEDIIALEDVSVLETATFKQNGDRFDVALKDGTLIRVNGVTEDDISDMFVFKSDDGGSPDPLESPTEVPLLKVVVFGGQSLAFGATGRDWVNTEAQYENSLMLNFDNAKNGARGWDAEDVNDATFNGFTPRFEVAQETPATGAMNLLASTYPDVNFVSLHYGQSGKSLDFIRENTLDALFQQLTLLKVEADAQGYAINQTIELAWIQGQSGSTGDYSDTLSQHQNEVEASVKDIFGDEFEVELYTTITRGFGGKSTTAEQFDAILDDPNIHLGSTEVVFNSQYPAGGNATNAHLSGEGYYMMGSQIASHILVNMAGEPLAPMAVEAVTEVGLNTYHIDFSGVVGSLAVNPSVYSDDDFVGVPDHFGINIYRSNSGWLPGEIVSSQIIDSNTIEITYSQELSGQAMLWVGRSESDNWMADGGGAGYGGTTLYDTGQSYTAVDPMTGLSLQQAEMYEFIPQQSFDFWV